MAWSTYPITNRPAALRQRLGPALARCQTLKVAFEAAADELAIDWAQDLHRTARLPAALVGALVDPAMTRRIFAELTFPELLDIMSRLDEKQKAVIAALGGLDLPDIANDDFDVCRAAAAQMRADFNYHLRHMIDHPALAGWFAVTVPDDGRYQAVRPAGYTDTCEPSDLALYQRPQALKALPAPARAALIVVTTAYNDQIARDRFKGRGLKFSAGEGAAALWQIEDQALRNSAFGLLASYAGW
jgi:hypothetical protein